MKKAFSLWFGLTMLAVIGGAILYLAFILVYPFSNSSIDTVEELTVSEVYPSFGRVGQTEAEVERKLSILENLGIDVDKELLDALEDDEEFRDIKIEVIATKQMKLSREDDFLNKVDLVSVTFLDDADSEYDMRFWIVDKSIWPPTFSKPLAIESTVVDYQGEIFRKNVSSGDPNNFFIALFK